MMGEKDEAKPRRTSRAKKSSEGGEKPAAPGRAVGARRRTGSPTLPEGPERVEHIAVAAYYRAERRGFAPGGEVEDWLAAEADLAAAGTPPRPKTPRPRKPPARSATL
jgi:hypothetical protein